MAQINVSIAGRTFRMACNDGEEDHLKGLAARLDGKIADIRDSFGEIGDTRITVMAGITLADELSEAERRIAAMQNELDLLRGDQAGLDARAAAAAEAVGEALEKAAARIDRIAHGLNAARRE